MRLTAPFAIVIILFAGLLQAAPHASAATTLYTLSGKVVSDAGEPLKGVTVSGWSSGPDGDYTTDNVLTGEDGSFKLSLGAGKGSISAWYEPWRANADLALEVTGDASGLVLTLKTPPPRTALVEGVVTDAAGNPVADATVTIGQGCCYRDEETKPAAPPSEGNATMAVSGGGSSGSASGVAIAEPLRYYYDGDYQQATTGADGKFAFKTYAGPRQLTAVAKGYAQTSLQVDAVDGQTVRADMTLEKVPAADAVVKGRVVDAKTGLPVANAGVNLNNLEWGRYEYRQTGADGSFEFKTLPGWTQISVYYYGEPVDYATDDVVASDAAIQRPYPAPGAPQKQYYQWIRSFDAKSGETVVDAELEPKPDPTVVLLGYVLDPAKGAGVPGASVTVWNQDTGDWGSAVTDETGSYRILVRAGHYTMNAYAEKHLPGAAMFVVADGETTKRVDIETPAGQQKYAPCDDCGPYPMPLIAKDMGAVSSPSSAGGSDAAAEGRGTQAASSPPAGADSTRAAAYSGSGGGLPAYDPAKAGESSLSGATQTRSVPGAALGFAVLALAGIALALRRR